MYRHILVPTDGSETADKALDAAIDHARDAGARLQEYERQACEMATGFPALVYGSVTRDVLVNSDIPTFVYR